MVSYSACNLVPRLLNSTVHFWSRIPKKVLIMRIVVCRGWGCTYFGEGLGHVLLKVQHWDHPEVLGSRQSFAQSSWARCTLQTAHSPGPCFELPVDLPVVQVTSDVALSKVCSTEKRSPAEHLQASHGTCLLNTPAYNELYNTVLHHIIATSAPDRYKHAHPSTRLTVRCCVTLQSAS